MKPWNTEGCAAVAGFVWAAQSSHWGENWWTHSRGVGSGGCVGSLCCESWKSDTQEQRWQAVQHRWHDLKCQQTFNSPSKTSRHRWRWGRGVVDDIKANPLAVLLSSPYVQHLLLWGFVFPFKNRGNWAADKMGVFVCKWSQWTFILLSLFLSRAVAKLWEWIECAIQASLSSELISTIHYPDGNCFLFSAHLSFLLLLLFWCWPPVFLHTQPGY